MDPSSSVFISCGVKVDAFFYFVFSLKLGRYLPLINYALKGDNKTTKMKVYVTRYLFTFEYLNSPDMFLLFCQLLRILSKTKMPVFQAPAKQDLNLRFEWNAKMVFFPPTNFKAWAFLARILIALIRKIHRMIFSNSKGQNCLTLISRPRTNSETFCFLQPFTRFLVLTTMYVPRYLH